MSNILNEVLKLKPSNWEYDTYEDKIFSRKVVSPGSSEYAEVLSAFHTHYNVKKIERVQNPYTYGKYIIRKEQLSKRGQHVNEVKFYIGVKIEDIDCTLEYNCDQHFANVRSVDSQRSTPTFYLHPISIPLGQSTEAIIVLSALLTSNVHGSFSKSTDTEYYPQYIVFF